MAPKQVVAQFETEPLPRNRTVSGSRSGAVCSAQRMLSRDFALRAEAALAIALLSLPWADAALARYLATRSDSSKRVAAWVRFRRHLRILIILAVPSWWSLLTDNSGIRALTPNLPFWVRFLVPLSAAFFLMYLVIYKSDADLLDRNWSSKISWCWPCGARLPCRFRSSR
jgi:hypothetical protein